MRKVLSTKLTAPPATSSSTASHSVRASANSTTSAPQTDAADAISAPWRRARLKEPENSPARNTPAG